MIKVNFFAALREALNCNETQLKINGPVTVDQARLLLIESNPSWAKSLTNNSLLTAVNQELVQDDFIVNQNDELAFFPPVTGG
ncbi:MoaD/ThiS family protein [Pseudocolwellia sp. HL-MZ19]|uniref:MoaD/ThiS family protein n=1 Tax=unclassified Pseudocolwellia TaxID=2848178 RepID=UPI003CEC4FB7